MRMKKLLMFLVLLTVSVGSWAYSGSGTNITLSEQEPGGKQVIVSDKAGALAAWFNSLNDNEKGNFADKVHLKNLVISGSLNAADLAVLNTTNNPQWSKFETVDMSGVTLETEDTESDDYVTPAQVCAINFSSATYTEINNGGQSHTKTGPGATYIRLPNSMTSAEDVAEMAKMKQGKNSNLKVVGAYDPDNEEKDNSDNKWAKVSMHSFEANNVTTFINTMNIPVSGNPNPVPREIRMSGEYGDKDLVNNGPNFGHGTSAIWDFTGAHFADCTIADATQDAAYYNYDDPFRVGELVACPTTTNSFYYFNVYKTQVLDIKLPDNNMTHLPFRCLQDLGSMNKGGYVALYGQDAFDANKVDENCVPIETLQIPNCYTDLDEECGKWARIRHLVIGSGMKRIHGGAFLKCDYLEDLDFAAGLSDCYIGDRAFNQCEKMKHIALSEGIVSLGNGAFWNSQHLESIRLPQSLLYIGDQAFNNCLALNSITIPENVVKIGKDAFRLCPLTDIYLTTTDPNKIPLIFTGGNTFANWGTSSFYNGHYNGWTQLPSSSQDKAKVEQLTWEQAVDWYFVHCNGIPVLHYPKQLANKVKSYISTYYHAHSTDGKGLPMMSDMNLRATADGANVGTAGQGIYTRDGWAQFMLMEEYDPNSEDEVYSKEYDDVWYTMCFPFDLTDEQLAAAFNETFNIVDFSGVEIRDVDDGTKNLVLHFNTVALTTYKDNAGNVYQRKMVDGKAFREKDTDGFEYNVYFDQNNNEYHHCIVSDKLSSNKTKTFARGNSLAAAKQNKDNAIVIDGVLAEAGHPYMIHPAIGVNTGQPMKRCYFSGIKWLDNNERAAKYEERKRVVNLSVGKGTVTDDMKTCVPSEDNYLQKEYSQYTDQTYTFKGNYKVFKDGTEASVASEGPEPVVPKKPEEPTRPADPDAELSPFTADDKVQPSEPIPANIPPAPTHDERGIYYLCVSFWGTYDEITCTANQSGNEQWDKWDRNRWELNGNDYGIDQYTDAGFNTCKAAFNKTKAYVKYEKLVEKWNAYNAYIEAYNAYHNYNPSTAWSEYENELNAYNTALENHQQWENKVGKYKPLIPTGAYFLGRRGRGWPMFYREIADDTRTNPTGGFWTQYTAIVEPNQNAKGGIEHELDTGIANNTKGLNMVFDEGFMGEFDPTEIKDIVAEAEEKGQKVEYMNIVYSINGEVVGHGSLNHSTICHRVCILSTARSIW